MRMTQSCRFSRFRGPVLALAAAFAAQAAWADPDPKQAAACVAALQTRAEPIAQRLREGDAKAEAQLLPVVTASFAFVGTVYKQGVRGAEADALLKEAEKAQAGLPPADLERTQNACQTQGEGLLKNASFFERQFVHRAARKRIDRLRNKPAA